MPKILPVETLTYVSEDVKHDACDDCRDKNPHVYYDQVYAWFMHDDVTEWVTVENGDLLHWPLTDKLRVHDGIALENVPCHCLCH